MLRFNQDGSCARSDAFPARGGASAEWAPIRHLAIDRQYSLETVIKQRSLRSDLLISQSRYMWQQGEYDYRQSGEYYSGRSHDSAPSMGAVAQYKQGNEERTGRIMHVTWDCGKQKFISKGAGYIFRSSKWDGPHIPKFRNCIRPL